VGAREFDIERFGAVADTSRLSTEGINAAVRACFAAGGGKVVIPAGQFKSGTITLMDNVELFFERGAVLYGSTDHRDYPRQRQPKYRSQKDAGGWYALIYAEGAKNIGISGYGTIDGQGAGQVPRVAGVDENGPVGGKAVARGEAGHAGEAVDSVGRRAGKTPVIGDQDGRPRNILFISCRNVSVKDIFLRNSGVWNQHYLDCEDVVVDHIRVYNHSNRNNDGIDIDGCRRVIVSNSVLDSDDDCITLKSTGPAACEDVVISDCIASSFCNAIKCGTESTGGFRNIVISHCIVKPSACPTEPVFKTPRIGQTGLALEIVDGGIMEGVRVSDLVIEGTECPIYVRLGNRARRYIPEATEPGRGIMRNISISHVTAYNTGNFCSSITGVPGAKIGDLSLDDIRLVNRGGLKPGEYTSDPAGVAEREKEYPDPTGWGNLPGYGFYIRHVEDIRLSGITLRSLEKETRAPVLAEDVDHLFIEHLRADAPVEKQVRLIGVGEYRRD
jgi:polygalacturonase